MKITLDNKIVIVTGGARGIGASIVEAFAQKGALVHFTYKSNHEKALKLASKYPEQVFAHCVNSCNEEEVDNFVKQIGRQYKRIDTLVNNAGIVVRSLVANITPSEWEDSVNTNLRAPFWYCTKALRYLMKSENPSIVNISSVTADRASVGLSIYCATKAGLEALSKVMTLEYAAYKIRVNTVAPGLIETDMGESTSDEFRSKILEKTPLKRPGKPEEVANAVLFLASPYASYITGSQVYVTGGRHLQ